MRYRRLDSRGDMTFGSGQMDFWIDQPEGVGQSIMTRLRLNEGEWFADLTEGTPWKTEVLGERTRWTRDVVVRERVDTTTGGSEILRYFSRLDVDTREWTAEITVNTVYGPVVVTTQRLSGEAPPLADGSRSPFRKAYMLGIRGGTPLSSTPAFLLGEAETFITDFRIRRLEAGTYT